MENTSTKPALTEKQWQKVAQSPRPIDTYIGDTPEVRHYVAALNLHEQPFGFTREDVEALGDAIYAIHGPKMNALRPGVEQALDSIRARIGSLLPPE